MEADPYLSLRYIHRYRFISSFHFQYGIYTVLPVPLAARSKAYVFGRSPAEIVGSNPTRGMDICL